MRENVPENDVASLQEELAAAKLREAEANLALKDLKSKVAELSAMWKKHLQQRSDSENGGHSTASAASAVPSTPKKLLGSLLEGKSEVARLEEELMTARLIVVESQAELKDTRLKVMELETQVCALPYVPLFFFFFFVSIVCFFSVFNCIKSFPEPSHYQSTQTPS